jgi:choline kinase
MKGASKDVDDFSLDRPASSVPRQHRINVASSRMTGRPAGPLHRSSRTSVDTTPLDGGLESVVSTRPNSFQDPEGLASRIAAWIQHEKHRRASRKAKRKHKKKRRAKQDDLDLEGEESDASSEGETALEHLQNILNRGLAISDKPGTKKGLAAALRRPSRIKLRRPSAASDTDFGETEDLVPTCDVILDNSKTLSYSGGQAEAEETSKDTQPSLHMAASSHHNDAWKSFKYEIVRLTHTLRLQGWRRVPMQMSSQIEVIRLCGALTNAVYEVLPPKELPAKTTDTVDGTCSSHPKSSPQ